MGSVARKEEMKQIEDSPGRTPNAERPTPNVELGEAHSAFGVRRSAACPERESNGLDIRRLLWRLLEVAIGAVFIYAGVLKALDPIGFGNDIENYHILPWPIGVRLAFYLPWLEIGCGLALWFRRATHGALTILGVLMSVFIVASIVAKARGIDVSCGCFGHAARNLSFTWHLAIDLALLAAIALVGWREVRRL
jgi:uncharacterized membrane protein YphA (DoxX/SURF4 family)